MSDAKSMGITLLRKRYFPNEEIDISDDDVLYVDDELLVTSWVPIRSRGDIKRGISYYFLNEGYKISKVFNNDDSLKYYYCDICRYEVNKDKKIYKMIDLLVDIEVFPDKHYIVLDFDELIDLFERKEISPKEYMRSVKNFSDLVTKINNGEFPYEVLDRFN